MAEFYLHWNVISGKGGTEIFEGISRNHSLTVVDFSWNNLGVGSYSMKCAHAIGEVLSDTRKSIVHLDLSYNKFKYDESIVI